jgi:branched-chain amino acid transport system ATP-binding protein
VIERLDLTVASGDVLGILGPNGAGKSTLFNLIAGVLQPSAGRILFEGRDITRLQ